MQTVRVDGLRGRVDGVSSHPEADKAIYTREQAMDTFEIDLDLADAHGFTVTIPALPGLLILGTSLDEVLDRARAAIARNTRGCEGGRNSTESHW
jgi:hypothetical protein